MVTAGIIFFWFILLLAFWVLAFVLMFAAPYMAVALLMEKFAPALAEKVYGDKE